MSNYTEQELKSMTRVELRRAAIAALEIDNKECSSLKSQALIDRILEKQGGGNGETKATKAKARPNGGRRGRPPKARPETKSEPPVQQETSGDLADVISRIDAVGKTLDEDLKAPLDAINVLLKNVVEQQLDFQRQQYMIFGLVTDLYKFTGEPDELEERLTELENDWDNQGND